MMEQREKETTIIQRSRAGMRRRNAAGSRSPEERRLSRSLEGESFEPRATGHAASPSPAPAGRKMWSVTAQHGSPSPPGWSRGLVPVRQRSLLALPGSCRAPHPGAPCQDMLRANLHSKKKKKTIKGREEPAAARREDASSPALRAVLLRARTQREGQAGLYAGGGARGIRATPQPPAGGPEWEQNERDCTFSGEIGSLEAFEPASGCYLPLSH